MKLLKKAFSGIVLPLLFCMSYAGTSIAQKSDTPIPDTVKKQIIDKAFSLLKNNYIFPEKIARMEKTINTKLADGYYSKFSTGSDFLKNLNNDLETLSNDRHIDIFFDPIRVKQIETEANNVDTKQSYAPEFLQRAKYENYMVRKAERLDGNVGYLKFNAFVDPELAKPTLTAAMNFLSNSYALIIDLRQNGGGDARTCMFLLNYFLDDSTLIMKRKNRKDKTVESIYTTYDPAIRKFSKDIAVYILVSKRTSSAAEAFAYTLQTFKKATVIGDTTNGEANPGHLYVINKEMYIMIPTYENVNPVTNTNWQGVGVIPDVVIRSDRAFDAAQAVAYNHLSIKPENANIKNMYEWLSFGFQAKAYPVSPSEKELQAYVGKYESNRNITLEQQTLFYQRTGATEKKRLIPLAENLFELEGSPFFRIRFIKNIKGESIALEGAYDDGEKEVSKKLDTTD